MDKVFPLVRDVNVVGIGIVVAEPHRVEPWGLLCVAGEHRLHRERSRGSVLSVSVFSLLINTRYGTVARAHVIWVTLGTGRGVPALHTVATPCSCPVTIVVIIVTLTGIST